MQNQPSVTACLTAYNAASFIESTLEALCRQTWKNITILIAEDASDDNTLEVIQRVMQTCPHEYHVFSQSERLGWVGNTNFLFDKLNSDYFFMCYHDDLLEPDYIERLLTAIPDDADVVGSYADFDVTTEAGKTLMRSYDEICDETDPVERGLSVIGRNGNPAIANRGIYRTSVLKTTGGLRENLAGDFAAAYPWVLGLALEGRFVRVPKVLCHKFKLSSGLSAQWEFSHRNFLAMQIDMYETIWLSSLEDEQKAVLMLEVSKMCISIVDSASYNGAGNHR